MTGALRPEARRILQVATAVVALAGLVFLPLRWIATLGLVMIGSHNLFDDLQPESFGKLGWLWKILHSGGVLVPADGYSFVAGYPLIPWMGVMAAGYGFGSWLLREPPERRKRLFQLGATLTALFILLRAANVYGDPDLWSRQKNALFTFFSFLY